MMALVFNSGISATGRRGYRGILALSYLCGLGFGMATYISAEDVLLPLARSCLYSIAPSRMILAVISLPFLLSVAAAYVSCPGLMVGICFLKTFAFSLVALGIFRCVSGIGYFALMFLCFTDLASMPLLYFWWLRSFSGRNGFSFPAAVLFLSGAFLIGSIYIRYICPGWV